jgi:hypothetical protein
VFLLWSAAVSVSLLRMEDAGGRRPAGGPGAADGGPAS